MLEWVDVLLEELDMLLLFESLFGDVGLELEPDKSMLVFELLFGGVGLVWWLDEVLEEEWLDASSVIIDVIPLLTTWKYRKII